MLGTQALSELSFLHSQSNGLRRLLNSQPTPEGADRQGLLDLLLWFGGSFRKRETGKAGSLQGAQQNTHDGCPIQGLHVHKLPTFALLLWTLKVQEFRRTSRAGPSSHSSNTQSLILPMLL